MKKFFFIRSVLFLSLFFFFANFIQAQEKNKHPNYSKSPYWIDMIKDPQVNYFEALKAYDDFWAKRKKPKAENDLIGQKNETKEKQNLFQRLFKPKEEDTEKYALDCKKFEHWKLIVKPYVQEDGRILNADEQLKIWQQQRQQ